MPFKDEIAAGEVLIYTGLRSDNWVNGTTGWRLGRDGSADLNNVTVRGTLQSANYAAGTAGYRLDSTTGDAELNDATLRGTLQSGNYAAGTDGYRLDGTSGNAELNDATLRGDVFFPVAPTVTPGSIRQIGTELSLQGPRASGIPWPAWVLFTQDAQLELRGGPIFLSAPTGSADTIVWITPEMFVRMFNTNDVSPTSTDHAFQIGYDTGQNLAMDGNEIMARDNGAAGTLNLQNSGGLLQIGAPMLCGDMRAADDNAVANVVTTSTTFVTSTDGPIRTFTYPPSGRLLVLISVDADNSAGGFSNMTFRIRSGTPLSPGSVQFTGGAEETARHQGAGVRSTVATFAVVDGLPTSGAGFVEGLYLASSGTATFRNADITVVPVL